MSSGRAFHGLGALWENAPYVFLIQIVLIGVSLNVFNRVIAQQTILVY